MHRRLAIIDPTPGGHQPMTTPDGRYCIVYNGEIYNYRELRADLERAGVRFVSSSDTEVLLALIVRDGIAALSRARGMFALAVWDGFERSLTVARDRFGIKPLYVAARAGRVAFASEIAALRRASLVDREVSAAGVLSFLAWNFIPPPLTWLRGVESLRPGILVAAEAREADFEGVAGDFVNGQERFRLVALLGRYVQVSRLLLFVHLVGVFAAADDRIHCVSPFIGSQSSLARRRNRIRLGRSAPRSRRGSRASRLESAASPRRRRKDRGRRCRRDNPSRA